LLVTRSTNSRMLTTPLRNLALITFLGSIFFWSACGDTFRPVVIPNPPTPPDPSNAHLAFAITSNGPFNPGALMLFDVSGDTTSGIGNVGRGPSHVTLVPPGATRIIVADRLEDTVSSISSSGLGSPATVSLPAGSAPVFVHTTQSGVVYVANSGPAPPSPSQPPSVAVINTTTNTVTGIIPLTLPNPVSLAQTPDTRKLYVASQGNLPSVGGVTSINTVDRTTTVIADPSGIINAPISATARSDSARVYVLNQGNGNLAVIDSAPDATLDTLVPGTTVSVGAGADFMLYDSHLNRLYLTNAALGTLTVVNVAQDPPSVLATLNLPAGPTPSCPQGCSSVAALPNGTRAYVMTLQLSGSTVTPVVTVLNPLNNSIVHTISLPPVALSANCTSTRYRISTAVAADSSRVYVGNCDAGSITVLRTSDDTLVLNLPAPVSAASPVKLNISSASQSGTQTTYAYALASGPGLQAGMSIAITPPPGVSPGPDEGSFTISGLAPGTFSVLNPSGVSAALNDTGVATPLQNPVFVLAGP
jgi:DNA-binding beta-propeller fold protein YncE